MARIRRSFVGIDVSQRSLAVSWKGLKGESADFTVANAPAGFEELCRRITSGRIQQSRVVLEATGPYHARVTRFLQAHRKVEVMVVPPVAAAAFAKASMRRAKTDRVDARTLLTFCETMPFQATASLGEEADAVRALGRHLRALIDTRAAFKSMRHSQEAYGSTVLEPHQASILTDLDCQIERVEKDLLGRLAGNERWARLFGRLTSLKGIAARSAGLLISEFVAMPVDLTAKQVAAFVGLDPRPRLSGSSRAGTSFGISKKGNARVRRTLFMTALVCSTFEPTMRKYYLRLVERGKPKKVALIALMRKILVSSWMMYARDEAFDPERFTRKP